MARGIECKFFLKAACGLLFFLVTGAHSQSSDGGEVNVGFEGLRYGR
jgi:hypothetical protein